METTANRRCDSWEERFNWSLSGYSLSLSLSLLPSSLSVQLTLITLNYDNNDVSESKPAAHLPRSGPVDGAKKLSVLNRIARRTKNLSDANCRNSLLGRELQKGILPGNSAHLHLVLFKLETETLAQGEFFVSSMKRSKYELQEN